MEERKGKLTDLGSNQGEIAGVRAGLGCAALAPIEEAQGVLGVPGHADGVDEAGGEDGLLEAVGAALAVEGGEEEPDGVEVIARFAEVVEELSELGALLGRRFAPLHPVEQAAHDAELGFVAHFSSVLEPNPMGKFEIRYYYNLRVLLVFLFDFTLCGDWGQSMKEEEEEACTEGYTKREKSCSNSVLGNRNFTQILHIN